MTQSFDPETHFTPEEYARINQPRLEREAAKARAAAKRAALRGDSPEGQQRLAALADEATQEEQRNRARLEELTAAREHDHGRPGMGKSTAIINLARHAVCDGCGHASRGEVVTGDEQ